MKIRSFLFTGILLFSLILPLLSQNYSFQLGSQEYDPIPTTPSLSGTGFWLDDEWTTAIGFDFLFFENMYDHLRVSGNGEVWFDANGAHGIKVLSANLKARGSTFGSESPISTLLEGDPGNRIFKIQWSNVGFTNGGRDDAGNFQLWLHEENYMITMSYGRIGIAIDTAAFLGDSGPEVGLYDTLAGIINHLEGIATSPDFITNGDSIINLERAPEEKIRYQFIHPITGISEKSTESFQVYPLPFTSQLNVSLNKTNARTVNIAIYDLTGKSVIDPLTVNGDQALLSLKLDHLRRGVYLLEVNTEKGHSLRRIVKQ